jgi:hypothetical protein
MDVFSTELGIQLSFVKTTSGVPRGGGWGWWVQTPLGTPLVVLTVTYFSLLSV